MDGFIEIPDDDDGGPRDDARIVFDEKTGELSIIAETTIEPKGLSLGAGETMPWKPGTALDGGPLTFALLRLALRMVEPDVIESPLATSNAWRLSISWNIAVEAVGRIALPIETSPVSLIRSAIIQSATYKSFRAAEQKHREVGHTDAPLPFFYFEQYRLPKPTTIPRREFLYGGHYLQRALSGTIAPGGFGKSTLSLVEAISMATGRDLLGHAPARKLRVLVWNGEETHEEMERRVAGICLEYRITDEQLAGRLMLASGRDAGLAIGLTRSTKSKVEIAESVVEMLTQAIRRSGADVVVLDPFVSVHDAPENDNTAMQVVVTALRRIADGADCAIEIVHHTRKMQDNKRVEIDDSRGGSALSSGTRSMRALNRMTLKEADKLGIENSKRSAFICIGGADKTNYQPPGKPVTWFQLKSVGLGNARSVMEPQDHVGVPIPWTPPPLPAEAEVDFEEVRTALSARPFREDVRSDDWIGLSIAGCLAIDLKGDPTAKKGIKVLVDRWINEGKLKAFDGKDDKRRWVKFVEVAQAIDDQDREDDDD